MFSINEVLYPLLFLVSVGAAYELNQSNNDVQTYRGVGLEEMVLFLVGLGVASVLGLAIVMGPLIALFYTSMNATNGANTVSTTIGASRLFDGNIMKNHMLEKLTEGLKILDEALKKHGNI